MSDVAEIQRLKQLLEAEQGLLLAYLYGSLARGQARAGSDIDIAVAFSSPLTPDARVELAGRLAATLGREVDLVDLHAARGLIASEALSHGKQLLNRDPALLAFFIKRMWLDQADYGPIRERALSERRKRVFGNG